MDSNAHTMWCDVKERFDKVNTSRLFYLHKGITTLTQGAISVSAYFSRMKELRDEFEDLIPSPICACA